jgi:UDP-GlcNAc:undecaprenyl-phosphate GlcNAc-1-phosphate transferase
LIGLLDDVRNLRPWQKLIGQVAAAVLAYKAGFGIHVLHGQAFGDWASLALTVVWLVGCTNALNLIDGMDGLAAGVGVFATLTSFVAALIHDNVALAFVTAPLVGALAGFLRYNFNPASIFLGDSGSLLIGFLLGCFGTMWGQKSATAAGMTAPLIALAMPLLDTGLAIARRFLRGQPIFSADRGHIHHRLLDRGLTPRRAVLVLYAFCGVAAIVSLLQEVADNQYRGMVIVLFCCSAWVGVQHLGYAEFGITSRIVLRGAFRRTVAAQMTLQQFERTLGATETLRAAWDVMVLGATDFGASGIRMEIGGEVFESLASRNAPRDWQVHVPLGEGESIDLWFDPGKDIQPVVHATLPRVMEQFITARFITPRTEPLPAARPVLSQSVALGDAAET